MAGSGIDWSSVSDLSADDGLTEEERKRKKAASGIDWSKVPEQSTPMRQLSAIEPSISRVKAQEDLARQQYGPAVDMNPVSKFGVGVMGGLDEKRLGALQFADALLGGKDKARLEAEAAVQKKTLAPLNEGFGSPGNLGMLGGNLVPDVLASATGAKGILPLVKKFGPEAPGFLARQAARSTGAAAQGATAGVTTPSEDYDPVKQGGIGAVLGGVADPVLRLGGRMLRPIQEGIDAVRAGHLANLTEMPAKLAQHFTDSSVVKALTNALAMTPAGIGVTTARRANEEAFTAAVTKAAGHEVRNATPEALLVLEKKLKKQYNDFDNGPDVPLDTFPAELQPTLDSLRKATKISGLSKPNTTLRNAIEGSVDVVSPAKPASGILLPNGQMSIPATPAVTAPIKVSAAEAIDLRQRASNGIFTAKGPEEKAAFEAVKDAIDNAIAGTRTKEEQAAFLKLNDQWRHWERIKGGGVNGVRDTLRPEDYVGMLDDAARVAPKSDLDKMAVSATRVMPTPSLTENRSLMTRALMGGANLAAGAGVAGAGGLFGPAGLAGAAGSLALAHKLLGTPGGGRYLTGQPNSALVKALQSERLRRGIRSFGTPGAAELYMNSEQDY